MTEQYHSAGFTAHLLGSILLGLLLLCICVGCTEQETLFNKLEADYTGIHFRNELTEDEQHNILNFTNLYTGSGVGIGDFNRDGLPDIFFGGNQESSRLYLNKGKLQFEDVTAAYGVETDRWVTGVAVVDLNADGWEDIYLSVSGKAATELQRNLLYINQAGKGFEEQGEAYGLADAVQSTHANFFDYDKDGDLDLFLIVNPTDYTLYNVNTIRKKKLNGEAASTDKLYRNNRIHSGSLADSLPPFSDVSAEAGILIEGYSLSLNVSDLTGDNWPDIYITNDFLTNDILYVNNQDGTFTNRAAEYFKHTSFASMGIDIADINNDGAPEVYVLDMFPEDNYRQKMILGSDNYDRFEYMLQAGYEPQYSRNTLQLNNGDGSFSEIGQLAKVHQTDWSWSALLADYDNDGLRDLFVTNGFRRDLGDLDYINYSNTDPFGDPASRQKEQLERIKAQPGAQLPNYIFKNENGWEFSKKSVEWGIAEPSYSHGAAYADLDLDGDLDLIVSNVSQTAFLYENETNRLSQNHYLSVHLAATQSIGTKVWIYYDDELQYAEYTPYRGYLSTLAAGLHFGLGQHTAIDSLLVQWPDGSSQTHTNIAADQLLNLQPETAIKAEQNVEKVKQKSYFARITLPLLPNYSHQEDRQIDFKTQALLPHQHSRGGPCLASTDINQDGLDDFYVGGAAGFSGQFFVQQTDGSFQQIPLAQEEEREDTDALFFDADQDGDQDLYVVSGGVVFPQQAQVYQDRLYLNEGGVFRKNEQRLPNMPSSGGSVAYADFDADGDLDLFVGGRVSSGKYPITPTSYLLENKQGHFKIISGPKLGQAGMVTSVQWVDIDQDKDLDLVLAGEFMPIRIYENKGGKISDQAQDIPASNGWWNSLRAGDFDQDGDMDFLAGNLGLNSNHKASTREPLCLYANDFDKNGSIDPVLCQYIDGVEYPAASRDRLIQQIPPIKARFDSYRKYALATLEEVFKKPEEQGMLVLEAQTLSSSYVENLGEGQFKLHPLPIELQLAPLHDFLLDDFTGDGHLDALAIGNSYDTEVSIGRYDAFRGALLAGDGAGHFDVLNTQESGFLAEREARSILQLTHTNNDKLIIVGNNSDHLQYYKKNQRTDY